MSQVQPEMFPEMSQVQPEMSQVQPEIKPEMSQVQLLEREKAELVTQLAMGKEMVMTPNVPPFILQLVLWSDLLPVPSYYVVALYNGLSK